jgi:hypothetical protein
MPQAIVPVAIATSGVTFARARFRTEALMRDLVSLQLYEDALREVQYAQRQWGDSAQLQATTAFIRHNQGADTEGRGALQRRARRHHHDAPGYPQFMAAGGEDLPPVVLRIIYPLD